MHKLIIEVEDYTVMPDGSVKIQLPVHKVTVAGNIILDKQHFLGAMGVPVNTVVKFADEINNAPYVSFDKTIAGWQNEFKATKPAAEEKEFDENDKPIN